MESMRIERYGQAKGIPVVPVHGFPLDGAMWEPQVQVLEAHRPVWVPDLLGFGKSRSFDASWSLREQADRLAETLLSSGAGRIILVGFSMGGYVSLAFASAYPEMLAGLVLADTRAGRDDAAGRDARTRYAERVEKEGTAFLIDQMIELLLAPSTLEENGDLVSTVRAMMGRQRPASVGHALLAMRDRPDRTRELEAIACPTLVLAGEKDAITPPEEMRALAEAIPGSRFVTLPRAGHLSNLERPGPFNAFLTSFLREVDHA